MRHRSLPAVFGFACGLLASAGIAQAGVETWVSGTGSDAGTCPITTPCRTFAFAHTQTSNNGSINVLTSGNFGPVTITKPISIIAQGVEAVINTPLNSSGITVQATAASIVSLRGLTIDMRGTNNNGITFLSGKALHVQDTVIRKTIANGIQFSPAAGTSELYLSDTVIANAGQSAGIFIQPSGSGNARVMIERVRVEKGTAPGMIFTGSFTTGTVKATVRDSVVDGNTGGGIFALESGGGSVDVMVDRSAAVNNLGGTGVFAGGANALIRIGDSTVTGNGTGLETNSGGAMASYGTNKVDGNATEVLNAPSATIPMK
jgi:hypothetical protein